MYAESVEQGLGLLPSQEASFGGDGFQPGSWWQIVAGSVTAPDGMRKVPVEQPTVSEVVDVVGLGVVLLGVVLVAQGRRRRRRRR